MPREDVLLVDLQQLQNFLVIAQEENITHAAEYLHISQPALSRQIQALEKEFGKPLLIREAKKVSLTKDGVLLRKRAAEITNLVTKTNDEMRADHHELDGDILLGVSETDAIQVIGRAASRLISQYPKVTLKLRNGNNESILSRVNSGVVDLGLYFGQVDQTVFNSFALPRLNRFGALLPKQNPLATKGVITPDDLVPESLILYQGALDDGSLAEWFQRDIADLKITGTFDMYLSAKKMVESGLGIALVFDDLVDYQDSDLVCRPIAPEISIPVSLIWKKYQIFSETVQALLTLVKQSMGVD